MATAVEEAIAADPAASLVDAHLKLMREIEAKGRERTEKICTAGTVRLKKAISLSNAVIDNTLKALGIDDPTEPDISEIPVPKPGE